MIIRAHTGLVSFQGGKNDVYIITPVEKKKPSSALGSGAHKCRRARQVLHEIRQLFSVQTNLPYRSDMMGKLQYLSVNIPSGNVFSLSRNSKSCTWNPAAVAGENHVQLIFI